MAQVTNDRPRTTNRLLSSLPAKEYQRLVPELERTILTFGDVLYDPGDTIGHVYFPNDSIVSLLSAVAERSTIEVGMIGNEGMSGISIFMGVDLSAARALVQGSGSALRITAAAVPKDAAPPLPLPNPLPP